MTEFIFRSLAEEHQENLPYYLEADGYDAVLKILDKVLDFFEDELSQDDRVGQWLGGGQLCVADITLGENFLLRIIYLCFNVNRLGLYLYRLYQLGLDSVYYQGRFYKRKELIKNFLPCI